MKTMKVASVEDYKIVSSFQTLRKTLLEDKFADRLEKPLAYWAMPNDRRLPLAFLGRTIKDLLDTPFDELSATPGIGQKKISCLVKLLSRATKDHPPVAPFGPHESVEPKPRPERPKADAEFDPAIVSEALWTEWRGAIERHGLGREKLGRLAPTLQALPTVIWHTPLEFYLGLSVSEIRRLKTHGEKRVRVVLEVFHILFDMFRDAPANPRLKLRPTPSFIEPVDAWMQSVVSRGEIPTPDEVREQLAMPLLAQLKIDAGDNIFSLSESRLGIHGAPQSVRRQAKELGITRARVYQLLEDCSRVMAVRWPEGNYLSAALSAKLKAIAKPSDDIALCRATLDLFFPGSSRVEEDLSDDDEPEAIA